LPLLSCLLVPISFPLTPSRLSWRRCQRTTTPARVRARSGSLSLLFELKPSVKVLRVSIPLSLDLLPSSSSPLLSSRLLISPYLSISALGRPSHDERSEERAEGREEMRGRRLSAKLTSGSGLDTHGRQERLSFLHSISLAAALAVKGREDIALTLALALSSSSHRRL
jgi:hypothetical protein